MNDSAAGLSTRVIIVTGLSGSGKTTVLHTLEDLGYYCVDNLPVELLPAFLHLPRGFTRDVFLTALVMDSRQPGFSDNCPPLFDRLEQEGFRLEVLFLEADDETLLRRFSETRRQHPLGGSVLEGIKRERAMLAPLRDRARWVLDTSRHNIHQLRREVIALVSPQEDQAPLQINLVSFGYKHGLPQGADLVMDVRFLPNPYFVDELRDLDGRHPDVSRFVHDQDSTRSFLKRFSELLDFLLPLYQNEGKAYLTIALGCTGGRHRSVAIVESIRDRLADGPCRVSVTHRDVDLG